MSCAERLPENFLQWNPMTDAFNARKHSMGSGALGEEVALAKRREGIILFVGGINHYCSRVALSNLFSKAGAVIKCDFTKRREDLSTKAAFVGYKTQVEAEKAIEEFNGFEFAGFQLRVSVALSEEEKRRRREEYSANPQVKYEPTFQETTLSQATRSHPGDDPFSSLNQRIESETPDPTKGNIWGPEDDFSDGELEESSTVNPGKYSNVNIRTPEQSGLLSYHSSGPLEVGAITDVYMVTELYGSPANFPCLKKHPEEISIHEQYRDRPVDTSANFEVGNLVAALYLGEYYRARIVASIELGEVYLVFFIDYGNEDYVEGKDIRRLDIGDASKPSFLINVSIEGTDDSMSEEYREKFLKMVSADNTVKISGLVISYDKDKNLYTFRMGNLSYRKDALQSRVKESSSVMSPVKQPQGTDGVAEFKVSSKESKFSTQMETELTKCDWTLKDVGINKNLKVSSRWLDLITLHFQSLEEFTLISDINLRNLSDMSSEFKETYRPKRGHYDDRNLAVGLVVVAFSDQYKTHFRGCVQCIYPEMRKVDVLFFDLGDIELLNYRNLYPIPEKSKTKPQLSITCCLEGAATSSTNSDITTKLHDIFDSTEPNMRRVQAKIKSISQSNDSNTPTKAVIELRISDGFDGFSHVMPTIKSEDHSVAKAKENSMKPAVCKQKVPVEDTCYHPDLVERVERMENNFGEREHRIEQLEKCMRGLLEFLDFY